ncbi:hypothetical protein AAMO2058_000216900 [Amorphochlora amoebiformis]
MCFQTDSREIKRKRDKLSNEFGKEIKNEVTKEKATYDESNLQSIHPELRSNMRPVTYHIESRIENLKIKVTLENVPPAPTRGGTCGLDNRLKKLHLRRSQLVEEQALHTQSQGDSKDTKRKGRTPEMSKITGKERENDEKFEINGEKVGKTPRDPRGDGVRRTEIVLQWQQKVFSPQELWRITNTHGGRVVNSRYESQVNKMLKKGYPKLTQTSAVKRIVCRSGGVLLSTMVHDDGYLDEHDAGHRVSTSVSLPPRTREKTKRNLHRRSEEKARGQHRTAENTAHIRGFEEFHESWEYRHPQRMYILASLDLPTDEKAKINWRRELGESECVVMELRYYDNQTLVVRPDFTQSGEWHPLRSRSGKTWRVRVEVDRQQNEDDIDLQSGNSPSTRVRFRRRAAEPDPWDTLPPPEMHRRYIVYAQLKKAENFDADRLRCRVRLSLPAGWIVTPGAPDTCLRGGEHNVSVTSCCVTREGRRVHHFGWCLELDLLARISPPDEENSENRASPPTLLPPAIPASLGIELLSVDYFGTQRVEGCSRWTIPGETGHARDRCGVWKAVGTREAQLSEFFLGGRVGVGLEEAEMKDNKKHFDMSGFTTISAGTIEIEANTALITTPAVTLSDINAYTTGNLTGAVFAAAKRSKTMQRAQDLRRSNASAAKKRFSTAVGKVVSDLLPIHK